MMHPQQTGLTPEKIQMFAATLAGLSGDEVRKAKLLFLKNEISELRAMKEAFGSFRFASGCFLLFPLAWPILWAQRRIFRASLRMQAEQIRNALSVWRSDLGMDAATLEQELDALETW